MAKTIVLPTNPADLKSIKDAVKEISDCYTRIDAEKDQIKSIVELIAEKYELPKSFIKKTAVTFYKSSFDKEQTNFEDWAELYEKVIR